MSKNEIRNLILQTEFQLALDRAKLRGLAKGLWRTEEVIRRAAVAYVSSRWILKNMDRSQSNMCGERSE
jgi:hypothetical protein